MPVCGACGRDNPAGFRFCGSCGAPLASAAKPSPPGRRERLERKVVTVLFCDLVGFTARSDQADPEDVGALLRPYLPLGRCSTSAAGTSCWDTSALALERAAGAELADAAGSA